MTIFCTVNWKNYCGRGVEYTNVLFDGIRRNLKDGTEGRFIVFTDDLDETGYTDGIEIEPLPFGLHGWFNKLALFHPDMFTAGERIIYFDLDTIIVGSLDDIAAYTGPFAILRDVYRPNGLQSSVMLWEAGTQGHIWEGYEAFGYPQLPGGDQEWIEKSVESPILLQQQFPHAFGSYKQDAKWGIPDKASVVFFHGLPRPHEVTSGWVPKLWKIGASNAAQLELVGNTGMDAIKANIQRAEAMRDANWIVPCDAHDRVAVICAGGPSIKDEVASIAAHVKAGATVFACNNVPRLLDAYGIKTDIQVIVDARPENAAFVDSKATCLFGSPCDKSVHDAAGSRLILWHPAFDGISEIVSGDRGHAYVGGGTTCGMKAATLAWVMGYRTIHLYGFDSCYRGDDHHAYPQALNDGEEIVDVEFDGKSYRCAPWMIQQAEDFEVFAPQLMDHGVELCVHGTGLIPDIAAEFAKGRFPAQSADFRAHAILERIADIPQPKVAEIGVFAGDLSRRLLARHSGMDLLMIDSWASSPKPEYVESGDFHSKLSEEAQQQYFTLASNVTEFAKGRRHIMAMDSKEAVKWIDDQSLDLVFIDADHSYEGCKSDIETYWPKVRAGGFISGHDYANDGWEFGPMVKRAVDEFVESEGLALELGPNYTWFAVKPGEIRT